MSSSRATTNELQAKLSKMGGSRSRRRRVRRSKTRTNKKPNKTNKTRRTRSIKRRRIRGGAVAPTTSGSSQGGSDALYLAQQQALANRAFDDAGNS